MKLLLLAVVVACVSANVVPLPKFNAKRPITVSGLSSGAFMAVQVHVAYSSWVSGAGVFAGGPFYCAEDSVAGAFDTCMYAVFPPNAQTYIGVTDQYAAAGKVDATGNLTNANVFMFSGKDDQTVHQIVMDALFTYYTHYVSPANVYYENNLTAAHTMPTDNPANTESCDISTSPYISDCNYDGAGLALQQLYKPRTLAPRSTSLSGQFINFDQTPFCVGDCASSSLRNDGWAYVPAACANNAACTVHVSFHGCEQNYDAIGLAWVQNSGYNSWADANNIVILYPQTVTQEGNNPNGCWNWWGYLNDADYADQNGMQMQFVKKLVFQATN